MSEANLPEAVREKLLEVLWPDEDVLAKIEPVLAAMWSVVGEARLFLGPYFWEGDRCECGQWPSARSPSPHAPCDCFDGKALTAALGLLDSLLADRQVT